MKEKELERVREQTESVWERERESKEKDGESVCVLLRVCRRERKREKVESTLTMRSPSNPLI